MTLEERCKLAYEIGALRARIDMARLSKEASWATIGKNFLSGAKTMVSGRVGGMGQMGGALRQAGSQMAQPFKNLGQTYRANRFLDARRAVRGVEGATKPNLADYGLKSIRNTKRIAGQGYTGALKGQGANLAAAGTVGAAGLYAMS